MANTSAVNRETGRTNGPDSPHRPSPAPQQAADPTLDDLLDDPLIRLVMASDGVSAPAVHRLVETVTGRIADGHEVSASACSGH